MALSPRDLLLAPQLAPAAAAEVLAAYGFADVRAADENLQQMGADPLARAQLGGIVDELLRALHESPDPDRALARFERLTAASLSRRELFAWLHGAPSTIGLLARVLGASEFMAEILIRTPADLYWIADPDVLGARRPRRTLRRELAAALAPFRTHEKRLEALRLFKRREMLHIGVRDILRRAGVEETLTALSELAAVLIDAAVGLAGPRGGFAVIGLGKLGGGELNFSSDVDLLYVHDEPRAGLPPVDYEAAARAVTEALAARTNEGHVFRVDLRLRPEGQVGPLASTPAALRRYYAARGRTWERLALLKAAVVAGDRRLGASALAAVRPFVFDPPFAAAEYQEVGRLKAQIDAKLGGGDAARGNVKLGTGGIREIELITQAMQARYGRDDPAVRPPGTLAALHALHERGRLPRAEHDTLAAAYVFLRDVENKLQMAADVQTHALPADETALRTLARTLGYGAAGGSGAVEAFRSDYARHTGAVHALFVETIGAGR